MPEFFVCEPGPMGGISIIFVGATARMCMDYINSLDENRQLGCEIYQRQNLVDGPPAGDNNPVRAALSFARGQAIGAIGYVADSNFADRERGAKRVVVDAFDNLERALGLAS